MNSADKDCRTCVHVIKSYTGREYDRCSRVGYYCSTEMSWGRLCNIDGDLKLWSPRPSLIKRIRNWIGI